MLQLHTRLLIIVHYRLTVYRLTILVSHLTANSSCNSISQHLGYNAEDGLANICFCKRSLFRTCAMNQMKAASPEFLSLQYIITALRVLSDNAAHLNP